MDNRKKIDIPKLLAKGRDPWACRSCGCCHWEVSDSRHVAGGPRRRWRVCRNCGEPMRTLEIPVPEGHTVQIVPESEID